MALTDEQIERYSRHIILKEVGAKGQKKLLNAKVLIIGAGGLGAPAAMYLGAAGVGTIGIVDADEVDLSNLQRQIIHGTADIGKANGCPTPICLPYSDRKSTRLNSSHANESRMPSSA